MKLAMLKGPSLQVNLVRAQLWIYVHDHKDDPDCMLCKLLWFKKLGSVFSHTILSPYTMVTSVHRKTSGTPTMHPLGSRLMRVCTSAKKRVKKNIRIVSTLRSYKANLDTLNIQLKICENRPRVQQIKC